MDAKVIYKYEKDQDDELNLNVGEHLVEVVKVDDGWCEGSLKGTGIRGMFPDNFVELIQPQKQQPPLPHHEPPKIRETAVSKKRRANVTYSYTAENEDELTLEPGQVVEILNEEEEGWWRGSVGGREGVFPSNFVAIEEVDEGPPLPPPVKTMPEKTTRPPSMVAMPGLGGVNPLELRNKLKPVSTSPAPPPDTTRPPPDRPRTNTGSRLQRPLPKAKVMFAYVASQEDEITVNEGDTVEIVDQDTDQDGWWKIRMGSREGLVPDNFLEPLETAISNKRRAKVTYSHTAENEDELSLEPGQVVEVLNEEEEDGWSRGSIGGREGVFPSNFVTSIEEVDEGPPPHPPVKKENSLITMRETDEEGVVSSESDRRLTQKLNESNETERVRGELLQKLQQKDEELETLFSQLQLKDDQLRTLQAQITEKDDTILRQENTITHLEEQVKHYHENPHWIVQKEEVVMTEDIVGRGGWAEVKVGIFRGTKVAVKRLHEIILSDYYLELFSREMDFAAQVRHPNLLQFIGAIRLSEQNPMIMTELMPTSLRKELEENSMAKSVVVAISTDVVSALNYLHLWKPRPILHRDVSSANILLEPSGKGYWKAKLSDYGSANLLDKIRTVNPGNPVYSAPESGTPSLHSPAMDIYSFGVLLVEMATRCFPPSDLFLRDAKIQKVKWPNVKQMIFRCTAIDQKSRPSAENVLKELKELCQ